ncbi:MAG TPA: hypothetical protein DE147_06110 [Gammaproteobacteria bacterium]|nr:hypothetical protein [Gammaproteobacteria bacterium]
MSAIEGVNVSALRELKMSPKDLDGLIVQRKKLNQLHSRHEQLQLNIRKTREALALAEADETSQAPLDNPFEQIDLTIPNSQDNPYPGLLGGLEQALSALTKAKAGMENLTEAALTELDQSVENLRQDWLNADSGFPPSDLQQEQFDSQLRSARQAVTAWRQVTGIDWQGLATEKEKARSKPERLEYWLKQAKKAERSVVWPTNIPMPSSLEQLRQEIDEAMGLARDQAHQQQVLTQELQAISATLDGLIDNGAFKKAIAELGRCRKLQKRGAKGSEKLLNRISAHLGELSDWQQYAASPKRDALVQSIEDLVTTPLSPTNQRERIKSLREQWNALGPLPREQAALQNAFDGFAGQAFEICREHFNQQSKERGDNLNARKALCDQLQQYLQDTDWQQADMSAAENIMRQARQEWRKHHPCDRKALKPIEARFEELQSALHERVKNAWNTNVSAKESLVDQAQALVTQENSQGLATAAKQLQAQWRAVGTTPRGADQRLWKKFRASCDKIFARLDQERTKQRSAMKQQMQNLTDDIKAFKPDAQSIAESESQLATLGERARELRLDPASRHALKSYEQQIRTKRAQAQKDGKQKRLSEFRAWDVEVSNAEVSGKTIPSPHGWFNERIAGTAKPLDLITLTMEAEIAADIGGPSEEQSARMALQIELMNRGVRNMQLVDNQDLLQRWCNSGPKSATVDVLRERFFTALIHRLNWG